MYDLILGENNSLSNIPKIHPDIYPLLWTSNNGYEQENFSNEPSMIDLSLPVSFKSSKITERLPYYPSYKSLSSEQRGKYLKFLENPYRKNDIGYIFILYYGLERHLLYGDYERAKEVILKLRKYHDNKSFQTYSLRSLFTAAILNKDSGLLEQIPNCSDLASDFNLILVLNAMNYTGLSAEDIIKNSSFFGFTNKRYIKSDYNRFNIIIHDLILNKYNVEYVPLENYITDISYTTISIALANTSLPIRTHAIPDFQSNSLFTTDIYNLLLQTHEIIKNEKKSQSKYEKENISKSGNSAKKTNDDIIQSKTTSKHSNPKWHRTKREKEASTDFYLNNISDIKYHEAKIYNDFIAYDRNKDILERINACEEAISSFYEFQKYCYQSHGGTIYFQDHWEYCHNSKSDCFSYLDNLNVLLKKLKNKVELENNLKNLENDLYEVLSVENPILQSKLFSYYPPKFKTHIKKILDEWESYEAIKRTKHKNSYLVELLC